MTIAIDISQIVFEGTGVAVYTKNLVTELLKLNSNGKHNYILFGTSLRKKSSLDNFANELKSQNLKFKTSFWFLPPSFTSRIWNELHHVKIEKLLGKIDLFHSSDWTEPPTNAKKVTTIHDLVVYKFPESSDSEIVKVHKEKLFWSKKECAAIIVDSLATKKDCQEILSIPPEKMHVVALAPGNNVSRFTVLSDSQKEKEIARIREKYKLTKPYVLAVGTRQPRKNLDRLVEAASEISEIDLVIVGNRGWGEDVKNAATDNSKNIKILGFVDEKDVQPLYSGSVAYVHPSLYEGFGITILEAMALGVPVITSKISSLPEAGGSAAIYIDPKDAGDIRRKIIELINLNKQKRKSLIIKSLEQSKKFSWKKTAEQTLEIYEKLV